MNKNNLSQPVIIKSKNWVVYFLLFLIPLLSCKKYLDEKPDKKIATPTTLSDLEGIIDYYFGMNARYPAAAEVSADNYYLTDAGWGSASELHRNYYTWQKYELTKTDWSHPYNSIFYCNVVLESLDDFNVSDIDRPRADQLRGMALFIRASQHLALAQLFAPVYQKNQAGTELGIPLKLSTDVGETSTRSTVQQTYQQILSDLKNAVPLLPLYPLLKYRPSRPAAYGALARTYLSMQDYDHAGLYADSCLRLYDSLMEYSSLSALASVPFKQFNPEVIYDARTAAPSALSASRAKVDTTLLLLYEPNDLRKIIFFKAGSDGSRSFKGNYTGQSGAALFTGIATDEIYLIRSECLARAGNTSLALTYLNTLLRTRWKKTGNVSTYIDKTASSPSEALFIILTERRKQLLYRNLRWTDLRRLNLEPNLAVTLYRKLNNQVFQLAPGSSRYTLQIDQEAIRLSGMPQNP